MDYLYIHQLCLCSVVALYIVAVAFYRLVLSPLAQFPGPRLAAATGLYEAYFQLLKGGTFIWEINRLHQGCGPIIRPKPNELHIKDPDYYNTLYAGPGRYRNNDPWHSFISFPQSMMSTAEHGLHRAPDPDVPASEKESSRLEDDAVLLMIAGTDAPSQATSITFFHILINPKAYEKLRVELFENIPEMATGSTIHQLKQLPYLSARIKEGLRLSSNITTRLSRIAPDEVLQYGQWSILPGLHTLSMNWAWMYLLLGTLLRRYNLVLHETTERNVEMTRDNFIGQTDFGMNNIQVKVLGGVKEMFCWAIALY
ncbi:cytochrome P450 [Aspergillus transmontanensis]|uniref:Cytochrome P450 n=1 Tax=Aspergillus transmontanensis TaxID=1034304 RepID=A0A5N6VWT0_9EURO|nr:cytochrome P450 [Aspergillus transmontanensis]